jgi:hypothetical protein
MARILARTRGPKREMPLVSPLLGLSGPRFLNLTSQLRFLRAGTTRAAARTPRAPGLRRAQRSRGRDGRVVPGARRIAHGGLALNVDGNPVVGRRQGRRPRGRHPARRGSSRARGTGPAALDVGPGVEAPVGSRLVCQLAPGRQPADVGGRHSEESRRLSGREERIGCAHAPDCERWRGRREGLPRLVHAVREVSGRLRVRACGRVGVSGGVPGRACSPICGDTERRALSQVAPLSRLRGQMRREEQS